MSALVVRPGERIRVLRIIARLNVGGPALHVSLLTSMLDRSRFESRLVSGSENPGEGSMRYYAESRGVTGRVFEVEGGKVSVADGWHHGPVIDNGARWEPADVGEAVRELIAQAPAPTPVYGT